MAVSPCTIIRGWSLMELERWAVATFLIGTATGLAARIWLLRVDYRQYPSYPHNYLVHLTTGAIASVIGSIFLPALLNSEYTAVTFLVLVATQFREVRTVERETLSRLDTTLLVPRGADYIEGIAGVFEARNYLVMATAVGSSAMAIVGWHLTRQLWSLVLAGSAAGLLILLLTSRLRSGHRVGDIAEVRRAQLRLEGPSLYVDDIFIFNVGSEEMKDEIRRWGRGYRIIAKTEPAAAKLAHPGQRQAIVHDVVAVLGLRADMAMPELLPLVRQDVSTGDLGVYVAPAIADDEAVMAVIRQVPLLEGARGSDPAAFAAGGGRSAY